MRLFRGLDKAVLQRVGRCIPRIFPSDKKKDKNYILKEEKKRVTCEARELEMPKRFRITVSRVRFHWIKSSLTMTTVSLHLFPPLMLQRHARYYIVSMISKSERFSRVLKFFSIEIITKAHERDYIFNFLYSNLEYFFLSNS